MKKPDCRRRGDGDGGICDNVSTVRSERDRRGSLAFLSPSIACSTSVFAMTVVVLPNNSLGSSMSS